MNEKREKYYDLSATISDRLVSFPGDPKYKTEKIKSLENNSHFALNLLNFGNHIGTHIDFPSHVVKGGKNSNDYPIEHLIGSGIIIDVPYKFKSIPRHFVQKLEILPNDIVFFKTANSHISKNDKFHHNYVYLTTGASEELLKKNVKIVGIDYISVDKYDHEYLPVHKLLLVNDVLIVEGLELNKVPAGRYKIYILPLKVNSLDGLPIRVLAQSYA